MNYLTPEQRQEQKTVAWAEIRESKRLGQVLYAKSVGIITLKDKEVLQLDYHGITGYLAKDKISNYTYRGLQHLLGKEFEFVVENYENEDKELFVANRTKALEITKKKFWANVEKDQKFNAFIDGNDGYRLFLNVEGVEVILNKAEVSHSFVTEDLRLLFEIGELLPVQIIDFEKPTEEKPDGSLIVSTKALLKDPWETVEDDYQVNGTYIATVHNFHDQHGIFFTLPSGLIARSNFPSFGKPSMFQKGMKHNVRIRSIDLKNRKMSVVVIIPRNKTGMNSIKGRALQ